MRPPSPRAPLTLLPCSLQDQETATNKAAAAAELRAGPRPGGVAAEESHRLLPQGLRHGHGVRQAVAGTERDGAGGGRD